MTEGDALPHLGDRPAWGYMNAYEWDGEAYVPRFPDSAEALGDTPHDWALGLNPEGWRRVLLDCLADPPAATSDGPYAEMIEEMQKAAKASFSDGVNTGYYINAYTTKHCPTMDGVLEEMRRGIERMQQSRAAAQEAVQATLDAHGVAHVSELPPFSAPDGEAAVEVW